LRQNDIFENRTAACQTAGCDQPADSLESRQAKFTPVTLSILINPWLLPNRFVEHGSSVRGAVLLSRAAVAIRFAVPAADFRITSRLSLLSDPF